LSLSIFGIEQFQPVVGGAWSVDRRQPVNPFVKVAHVVA
jgi:hypothetical protein